MESQSDEVDEEQASTSFGNLCSAFISNPLQLWKVQHAMADPEIQRMLHDPQDRPKTLEIPDWHNSDTTDLHNLLMPCWNIPKISDDGETWWPCAVPGTIVLEDTTGESSRGSEGLGPGVWCSEQVTEITRLIIVYYSITMYYMPCMRWCISVPRLLELFNSPLKSRKPNTNQRLVWICSSSWAECRRRGFVPEFWS